MKKIHPGMVFVVVAWALNFCIVRLAYKEWTPAALMLCRSLGTLPALFLIAATSGAKLSAPAKRWPLLLLGGFLGNGLYMVFFLEGMKRTGAAQGAITLATAPLFIALIGFVLKIEKPTLFWAGGSALALLGVALTHFDGLFSAQGGLDGFLLVLASSFVWAVSVHVMRPLVEEMGPISGMALSLPGALLALVPYAGAGTLSFDYSSLTWLGWSCLAYMIVVSGALAFVAYYRTVQDLGAARASMTSYLIPPGAAVFAFFLLGDELHLIQVAGLALALGGVALAQRREKKPPEGTIEE